MRRLFYCIFIFGCFFRTLFFLKRTGNFGYLGKLYESRNQLELTKLGRGDWTERTCGSTLKKTKKLLF